MRKKVMCVVGARPNLMKMAPILNGFSLYPELLSSVLVHTGQHYDHKMNHRFFEDLGLPWPAVNLEVGSAGHITQIAQVMLKFEPVLLAEAPDAVLVVGDVNSTLACGLVANRNGVPLVHVEAGLRSFDRQMPEEINRVLVDQISDLLFTTERSASENLQKEGVPTDKIRFVGNVMIDSLLNNIEKATPAADILAQNDVHDISADNFALVTLHRPSNVDDAVVRNQLFRTLVEISEQVPLLFPMHPRTRSKLDEASMQLLTANGLIKIIEPLGYLDMLGAMRHSKFVLTDSGGVQEETTALRVPCITLRNNTERPVTVTKGTNYLVGIERNSIVNVVQAIVEGSAKKGEMPEYWDGRAAERLTKELLAWLK